MKNTINVSNNANLILNTYRCLFLKLLLRVFNVVQQRGNGKVLESALQHLKVVNQNSAKMVDAWNVNKLTEARTKMEAGKLRTKAVQ